MSQLEKSTEDYLVSRIRDLTGAIRKFSYIGTRGGPDRICFLPGGKIFLVEVKRPKGGRLSEHQKTEIATLAALGTKVHVVATKEDVDRMIEEETGK